MRPRVKICGLTRVEDAVRAVEVGADYLGLNFYPPSPRCLDEAAARAIARAVDGRCPLVGVFAGQSTETIRRVEAAVGLDRIQFHGDESLESVRPFASKAIKVFRVLDSLDTVDLEAFADCWAVLLDRRHDRLLGGTGRAWSWGLAADLDGPQRLFVAGGIGPETVRAAVAASGAWAVDVCSGIETAPGVKDWNLMDRLFEELSDG